MRADIVICSTDAVFARMLELEFSHLSPSVQTAARFPEDSYARVVLLDLDTVSPPAPNHYGCLIGFTRGTAFSEDGARRQCSMILRRPFEMRLLRREVLGRLHPDGDRARDSYPNSSDFSVLANRGKIVLCGQELSLSPTEHKILTHLIEHRGEVVTRETLSALIGETTANKADVYVCYLRRKLAAITPLKLIRTVRNQGYILA